MSTLPTATESGVTRVVELTPAGRAAVAVVLVDGPDAVRAVEASFRAASGRAIANTPTGRIVLGRWGRADGEELIACRRSADRVELHCHGGAAAIRAVVDQLCETGCRRTPWRDWLRDAAPDPIRAAAIAALADAPTARTAAVLLDQYDGALGGAMRAVLAGASGGDWPAVIAAIDAMLAHRDVGAHLTTPWRVVLAGPPNVGKSSLKNALVGYERAIICDRPGTTRDVVSTLTAVDGWPIQLSDTAGLRDAADPVEAAGVARAEAAVAAADLVLLVDDATTCRSPGGIANRRPAAKGVITVLNKMDLAPMAIPATESSWDVLTSAVAGAGVDGLLAMIGQRLVPTPPPPGAAVPFTADQVERLESARAAAVNRDAAAVAACLQPLASPGSVPILARENGD